MRKLLLAVALLPCIAIAQEEPKKFTVGDCFRAVWSDSRAAPVVARLGIGQNPIPLPLRASKAKADKKEKQSLEFVSDGIQTCQALDQTNRVNYHPLTKQAVDELETGYRSVMARVYSGDLTWGAAIEANEATQKAFERRIGELTAMAEAQQKATAERNAMQEAQAEEQRKAALRADFERQQRADAMQRQAEMAQREQSNRDIANGLLLLQMARPQPTPNPLMAPPISCSSRNVGGTVYTDCR